MATQKTTEVPQTKPISAQDVVALLGALSNKLDAIATSNKTIAAQLEILSTRIPETAEGELPARSITPTEASAILRSGRKGKAAPVQDSGSRATPAMPTIGQVIAAPSKRAAKAERKAVQASNSAKYTCACGGWGVQDTFRDKHVAKGHTVTQLR